MGGTVQLHHFIILLPLNSPLPRFLKKAIQSEITILYRDFEGVLSNYGIVFLLFLQSDDSVFQNNETNSVESRTSIDTSSNMGSINSLPDGAGGASVSNGTGRDSRVSPPCFRNGGNPNRLWVVKKSRFFNTFIHNNMHNFKPYGKVYMVGLLFLFTIGKDPSFLCYDVLCTRLIISMSAHWMWSSDRRSMQRLKLSFCILQFDENIRGRMSPSWIFMLKNGKLYSPIFLRFKIASKWNQQRN